MAGESRKKRIETPWRYMPVCTKKGIASSKRYKAEDERRKAAGNEKPKA